MREPLQPLDLLEAPDDWSETRRRVARFDEPPPPSSPAGRAIVVGSALLLAAFAFAYATHLLHGSPGPAFVSPSPPVHVVKVGEDGSTLWPERTTAALVYAQDRRSTGKFRWRLEPATVAGRFVESILGWQPSSFRVTVETNLDDPHHLTVAHVVRSAKGCRALRFPAEVPCRELAVDVTLLQPVTVGEGGIWAVSKVASPGVGVDLAPGQVVVNGSNVHGHVELSPGLHAIWEVIIGGREFPDHCAGGSAAASKISDIEMPVHIASDASTGSGCGASAPGLALVATSYDRVTGPHFLESPFLGSVHRWASLAVVPVVVSIPENVLAPGLSTYEDKLGWKMDRPTAWPLTHVSASGVRLSNRRDPTAPNAVSLSIRRVPIDRATAGDDSSFPLSLDDFSSPRTGERTLRFQGNGVSYEARLLVDAGADPIEIHLIENVIASIRFPSLEVFDEAHGWVSLGNSDVYSPGKGSPEGMQHLGGIYVMRGPAGDYVLAVGPQSGCGEGSGEGWDPHTLQIEITCMVYTPPTYELHARFDRYGTPLAGNPALYDRQLAAYPVITSWNGMLLVAVDTTLPIETVHRYWP